MERPMRVLAALSSAALSSMAIAANAQEVSQASARSAEDAASADQEILVTARMRTESLLDTPIAVNVFNEQAIARAGIERPDDFIGLVPNMTISNSQDAGTNFITVRGLTQVRNSESPVAVVVDGVLASSPLSLDQELFDISQIEVLKGPQGALYGRNAIGGAIIISTKQPTNELEGAMKLGSGDAGRIKAQGSVSGALIEDQLFFRIAASHTQHSGYLENIFLREKADPYRERSGRILLKWTPNEDLSVDLRASVSRTDAGALYFVVNDKLGNFIGDPNDTSVPIQSNIRGLDRREIEDYSAKVDYTTPLGTLTSVTAYNHVFERSAGDAAPYLSTPADGTQDGFVNIRAFSQELRLTSPSNRRLRYIVGAYYLRTNREAQVTAGLDLGPGVLKSGINIGDPVNPTIFAFWDKNRNEDYAGFGQLNFDITDKLELSGALRYDHDDREQTNLSPFIGNIGDRRQAAFSKWQPKVSLNYRLGQNLSIFASYGQGFRSGGFNQPGVAASAAAAMPPVLGVQDIYKAEESETYEVGMKSRLFDKLATLNMSLFKTHVDNQQYFSFIAATGAQIITNIDKVDIWGFEIETDLKPVDFLRLYANLGYTDTEIKVYTVTPSAAGAWAPYVPRYTVNLGAELHVPVSGSIEFTARANYALRGKQFWEPNNIVSRKAVELVDLRSGFRDVDDSWELTAWVRNLFNEDYNEEFVLGGYVQRALPRSFGIDLTLRF